jgi:hypothetical protein
MSGASWQIYVACTPSLYIASILPCSVHTKTGLVFGFLKNQILVAVVPGQKAPRTLLACLPVGRGRIVFGFFPKTILR